MKHLSLLCALALPAALHAQTAKVWNGTTGNWSSSNWNPGGAPPTAIDSASITTGTVTLDVDAEVTSFTFSGGSLLGQVGNPRSIKLSGQLGINTSSAWLGGTAPITITANGGMSHSTAANFDNLTLNLPVGTTFTQSFSGGSNSQGRHGAVINNAGTWNATNSSGLAHSTGTLSAFNNTGTFNRTSSGTDWNCSWVFNNSGTVNANTGTMMLSGGGASTGGNFLIAGGATVRFQGTHSFDAASSINGAGRAYFVTTGSSTLSSYDVTGITEMQSGTVTINNGAGAIGELKMTGGTGNFNGTASPTAFTITSGAANFANHVTLPAGAGLNGGTVSIPSTKNFTIPGTVTWNGSTLSGGGTFHFNGGATMSSGAPRVDGAVLNLAADQTVTHSNSGVVELRNGAIINNTGLWDSTSFNGFSHTTGTASAFKNSGVFTKRTSGSPLSVNAQFNNSGTVNVQSGAMTLSSGGTQSGAFNVATGCTLTLNGAQTFTGTPVFAGLGTVSFGGSSPLTVADYDMGGTTITSGTVNFNNAAGAIGAVTLSGGTANFNGVASPTSLTVNGGSANFANDVTITSAAPALTLSGGTLTVASGKTASFDRVATWAGTTLSGAGAVFHFNTGATNSSGLPQVNGATVNFAAGQTVTFSGGANAVLSNGAIINNAGTWNATGLSGFTTGGGVLGAFNNSGTFNRSTHSSDLFIAVHFTNTGTVNVTSGTIRFNNSCTQTSGSLNLNGGGLKGAYTFPIQIQGGSLTGAGTLNVEGVAVTAGTLRPRGILNIRGSNNEATAGNLTLTAASTLDVELGGTTPGTQYDQVIENGLTSAPANAFARNGTLAVRFKNGFHYTALGSDTFTILTSNQNTTGQFSNVSGGRITTADYKGSFAINAAGTTSVVLSDYQAYPDLDVEQPAGNALADGDATVDFALRTIGTPGVVKTFTIRNTGAAGLTDLAITLDGAHAADFSISTPLPGTSLVSQGTAEFVITFTPSGSGIRTAALHIASNDPNEAPFDIALTGEGNFAPVLTLPLADVEVEPESVDGAIVNFTVSATDFEDDPDPAALASPESGSLFPLGDTTVIVSSTDSRGANTTGTFTLRVLGGDPTATTLAPADLTTTSATLRATVNPNHFATSVQFVMDGNPLNPPVNVPAGSSPVTVTFNVSGLQPGSAHTANVQAINATGQFISGGTVNFTTLGGPPAVTTTTPTMITPTKAKLTATVNPNHLATVVSFHVGGQLVGTVNVPAGSTTQTVTFDYAQLIPGQSVSYQVTGSNLLSPGVDGGTSTFDLMASDTTFGTGDSVLYSANTGWIHTRPAVSYGLRTGDTVCSGFLYAANFGWIHAGTGEPADGVQYSNTGSDYGINVMPDGTLRGHAWSGNIGWISFEGTGSPAIDLSTGALSGHAWSGNVGWINLGTAVTTQLAILDTDADGISDAWENARGSGVTGTGAASDADADGISDYDEYLADSDPLHFTPPQSGGFEEPAPDGSLRLTFPTSPTRFYQVQESSKPAPPWTDTGLGWFRGSTTGTTTVILAPPADARRFYQVVPMRPLSP